MRSILNWYTEEGIIFKGGSGAGVNLSKIRSSAEVLEGGGTASGPVSFMRGADASAGTIKSGGKTRRAAKMVILDADHPDIEEFIWCKANEENKARVLRDAGFDMDLDGKDIHSIQYQNANNSVRVSDEFMEAVLADGDWDLTARGDGRVVADASRPARLWRQIAQAAWECADPGLQFDTTINSGTRRPNTIADQRLEPLLGVHAHRQLRVQPGQPQPDEVPARRRQLRRRRLQGTPSRCSSRAQEIIVGAADYPTEKIAENSRKFRQLGLGYANLGALLMASGLAYDSDAGRAWAAAITALMTGHAYATSARTAGRMGPHEGYAENAEPMLNVLTHAPRRRPTRSTTPWRRPRSCEAAQQPWEDAVDLGARHGVRNAQASVLAPTGTIGLLDGLRHDRHRARPRTGEVQEAGRRRQHVHRQPDRAARPAQARLQRDGVARHRGLHRREQVDRRRARASTPSTCRSSPARWATTRSTTSVT